MEETDSVDSELQHMSREEFKNYLKKRFSKPHYPSRKPASNGAEGAQSEDSSDVYNFDHPHRGLTVIINNEKFKNPHYNNREGSGLDEIALEKSFSDLGFHVEVFKDLKAEQMFQVAQAAASIYGHQDADCFAFAILTHGDESKKDGKDNTSIKQHVLIDVDGTAVETEKIIAYFSDANCPSLIGKPRLFFIQACRGVQLDGGVKVKDLGNGKVVCLEAPVTVGSDPGGNGDKVIKRPAILYPDSLVMYASPPGYLAWRRKTTGSWFIQELCKFLDYENIGRISFVRGLTSVCRKVACDYESETYDPETMTEERCSQQRIQKAKDNHGKKSVPVVESQLLNDIYMTRHGKCS